MPEAVWRAKSPEELCWHQWGEAHFVFDPRSGQTHFLNELGAKILRLLTGPPLTGNSIYTNILKIYSVDNDSALMDAIRETLGQLDDLGLVEQG